jgi:spermidine synthase
MRRFYVAVFATGAVVLIVEVASLRLFAPFFGTTLYVTSSVLGIVLGALALGYMLGGRLGDRKPEERIFWLILAWSGAAVLVSVAASLFLLPALSRFDIRFGALAASFLLLSAPNVLLGMLSPFVIRLAARRPEEFRTLGKISGNVFFISTVGSIVGSLSTGFLLVPLFGVRMILGGAGALLLAIGFVGLLRCGSLRTRELSALLFLYLLAASAVAANETFRAPTLREIVESAYSRLAVEDTTLEGRPARILWMDRSASGGDFLDTGEPAFPYARALSEAMVSRGVLPSRALVIGAGPFTIPKEILRKFPSCAVTVVDIDPALLPIGERWFGVDAEAITYVVEDGRRFLAQSDATYDLIVLDAFGSFLSVPMHMTTEEFFTLVRAHLAPQGVVFFNTISILPQTERYLASIAKTFTAVFPQAEILPVRSDAPGELQNFLFASESVSLPRWHDARSFSDKGIILTDRYAPVETMLAPALRYISPPRR